MLFLAKLFGSKRTKGAIGLFVLNGVRCLNIVALITVAIAAIVIMIKTTQLSHTFVFEAAGHLVTMVIAMLLLLTEMPWLGLVKRYCTRNWPMLAPTAGFTFLGIVMICLSFSVLGSLNNANDSYQKIGESFWQVNIAGGVLSGIAGIINVIAGFVFANRKAGVSARMVRSHGASAEGHVADMVYIERKVASSLPSHSPSFRSVRSTVSATQQHQQQQQPGLAHGSSSPPLQPPGMRRADSIGRDTLPSYYGSPGVTRQASAATTRPGLNISAPYVEDQEQFAKFKGSAVEIRRPDDAAHPAFHGSRF